MKLRSVELQMPDTARAAAFLTEAWGLVDAGARGRVRFLRATGDDPYVLSLAEAGAEGVRAITFAGSAGEVGAVHERATRAGARCSAHVAEYDEPGAASGFLMEGPEGQLYRFVTEKQPAAALAPSADRPIRITHAVVNARDRAACTRFAIEVPGFRLSDRTAVMSFLRCNRTHHALAFADSTVSSLNHIAFEMESLDAVMKGIGRLRDRGVPAAWGPGRHGPGNNVFGYFVAPFGGVIEYTAEVGEVEDDHRPGEPEDWRWPPGRVDHWGISDRDHARLAEAEKRFGFRPFAEAA